MDPEEIEARKYLGVQVQFGHCLSHIFPQSSDKLLFPSHIPLFDQLLSGINLNNGAQKFYINKQTNSTRVYIPPKSLTIAYVDDCRHWEWIIERFKDYDKQVLVPRLLGVSWLDVRGSVKACLLSPNVLYLVAFVVLLCEDAEGWNVPVNVLLTKPNGSKIESKVSIAGKPKKEYFEIDVGELTVDHRCNDIGLIHFAMYEHGCHVKKGLLIKGVVVRSKASDGCPHALAN